MSRLEFDLNEQAFGSVTIDGWEVPTRRIEIDLEAGEPNHAVFTLPPLQVKGTIELDQRTFTVAVGDKVGHGATLADALRHLADLVDA